MKEQYLDRVKAHRKADEIIKGEYWVNGKGCAVGCTIHSHDHGAYETELGIPVQIAHLQDWLFENLPNGEAKDFPVDFLESIPVGADLRLVLPKFVHWLLVDPENGVIQYAQGEEEEEEKVRAAISAVADLHYRVIEGQEVTIEQWNSATDAAARTTRAADDDDAASAAASAAAWPVSAAAWSARAAARAAGKASAKAAAKTAALKSQKEKLLELLAGGGGKCLTLSD